MSPYHVFFLFLEMWYCCFASNSNNLNFSLTDPGLSRLRCPDPLHSHAIVNCIICKIGMLIVMSFVRWITPNLGGGPKKPRAVVICFLPSTIYIRLWFVFCRQQSTYHFCVLDISFASFFSWFRNRFFRLICLGELSIFSSRPLRQRLESNNKIIS